MIILIIYLHKDETFLYINGSLQSDDLYIIMSIRWWYMMMDDNVSEKNILVLQRRCSYGDTWKIQI